MRYQQNRNPIEAIPKQDLDAFEGAILVDYCMVEGWRVFTSIQIAQFSTRLIALTAKLRQRIATANAREFPGRSVSSEESV